MALATVEGVIRPEEIYSLDEARKRLRLGEWSWKKARRRGLRTLKIGRRGYIKGSEIIRFAEEEAERAEGELQREGV